MFKRVKVRVIAAAANFNLLAELCYHVCGRLDTEDLLLSSHKHARPADAIAYKYEICCLLLAPSLCRSSFGCFSEYYKDFSYFD